jgi:hypothetical protein
MSLRFSTSAGALEDSYAPLAIPPRPLIEEESKQGEPLLVQPFNQQCHERYSHLVFGLHSSWNIVLQFIPAEDVRTAEIPELPANLPAYRRRVSSARAQRPRSQEQNYFIFGMWADDTLATVIK